jgi:PAS domain S-box-containing protein
MISELDILVHMTEPKPKPAAREALRELSGYKLLIESVQDYAIFLLDKDGIIMTWNKGAERNKGYKESEIVGKHFSVFYPESDKKAGKPQRELEIAQKVGRIEDEDWRIRKDGTRFWANVVITALHNESGELVGFAKVTRNLTERKEQEDELRRANVTLKQQQDELRFLNAAKDEFISLASHQLRTPATAVKLTLGSLLEGLRGELNPEVEELVKKAYDSNERQIRIVNDLLRIAQVDAGKVTLRKSEHDLGALLDAISQEQAQSINERRQTLDLRLEKASNPANIDYQHLHMALSNIIDNASKYTYPGGLIAISVVPADLEYVISIQDSGVGIAPTDIPKLFTIFTRIPNELSDKATGTGLGLFWAHRIIELHGGDIEVESQLGEGTTFHISLPREAAGA